ncbi:MAG TPA: hypothetical protein VFB14_02105 [Bryobacteraceae bacterium]|jgi:hypothetical protein|nr:hypothetical protein [Bryobacteraceae bacterium]
MKASAFCILLFLSAGAATADPVTITSGSVVATGNFDGTFHLVSDTFDISGAMINANEDPIIFEPLGPYVNLGNAVDPWMSGDSLQPFMGSGTIDGIHYDSISFGAITCDSCRGPASYFDFTGPSVPLELPEITAAFTMSGEFSAYTTGNQANGDCLLCAVPWSGAGVAIIHTQLFPNGEYGYQAPLTYDFVPEPQSMLLIAGGAAFLFFGRALFRAVSPH